jgi:hypothetical protein
MIKLLLNSAEMERYDLSSLRHVVYGGAPMYVDVSAPRGTRNRWVLRTGAAAYVSRRCPDRNRRPDR